MTRCSLLAILLIPAVGCVERPEHVDTIRSPLAGLFVTVEVSYGGGPAVGDVSNIYAHLDVNGRSDKQLILSGDYFQGTRVIWQSPSDVELCLSKGALTDRYRNQVTLSVGDSLVTVHSHIDEPCAGS